MPKNIIRMLSSITLAILLSNCGGGNSIVTSSTSVITSSVAIFDSTAFANDD